jgi:FtsH-binding integral membrane protein
MTVCVRSSIFLQMPKLHIISSVGMDVCASNAVFHDASAILADAAK